MNDNTDSEPPFSRLVEIDKIPSQGTNERIEANREECARLADLLQLRAIAGLTADVQITPWRKQGFKVAGSFRAAVRQVCVVTLDPFDSVIEDQVERYYLRGNMPGPDARVVTIDALDDEDTEALKGNVIDAGELIRESLTLALDPYPRKPGATFEGLPPPAEEDRENPFAVLKQLKRPN